MYALLFGTELDCHTSRLTELFGEWVDWGGIPLVEVGTSQDDAQWERLEDVYPEVWQKWKEAL